MKRTLIAGLFPLLIALGAGDESVVQQADRALAQSVTAGDQAKTRPFLDKDFTWTDSKGRTQTASQFLDGLVPSMQVGDTQVQVRMYGQVGVVTSLRGRERSVRIWVKRPEGWRVLVSQDVSFANSPAKGAPQPKDCDNPCKTVPYHPKSADEQALIRSWQGIETSVTHHDSAEYSRHVMDEFTITSPSYDHPITKTERMAMLDEDKKTDAGAAPPPLVSAQLYHFGDTVVMIAMHQYPGGKPLRNTRVWVRRDGLWRIAISQQTPIQ